MGLLRILWYSNAPWAATGYGTQTAQVIERLIPVLGADNLFIANNYGFQAGKANWKGVPVLAQGYDPHSRDSILPHAERYRADWIVTLYDVWVFDRPLFADRRVASWVPIDHDPAPPAVVAWCREHYPIAMSRFGQQALAAQGVKAAYVPHALDTKVFRPRPSDVRQALKIPDDAFLIMVNAANKGLPARKAWVEMLRAYGEFAKRHDDAYIYLHTDVEGLVGGMKLPVVMAYLNLPADRIRQAPQYELLFHEIPAETLSALYSASDVLLATSMGEGFGLAVIEAQACGLPVIVTDFTAQSELCGAGWKVAYQPWYDFTQGTDWATPLIPDIVEALEKAYAVRGNTEIRRQAVEFAQQYDADTVFERYWKPVLAEMEGQLTPDTRPRNVRRAERRAKGKACAR